MNIEKDFVHLARFTIEGKENDARALIKKVLRNISKQYPELSEEAKKLASMAKTDNVARGLSLSPIPVDHDSRLELVKREDFFDFDVEPIWQTEVSIKLNSVLREPLFYDEMEMAGIKPTRSLLFVGPPGVGKTFAARWLARERQKPLFILDLAAVMSSFLGRTGNNIRTVIDYAQREPSILLLDEFDAIAKRRDDIAEIGELKRLVTVILQSIEEWPTGGLLIAASNHPDLLDPAVWRRFDEVVHFPLPTIEDIKGLLAQIIPNESRNNSIINALSILFQGQSFAETVRQLNIVRRSSIINNTDFGYELLQLVISLTKKSDKNQKLLISKTLIESGLSQREVSKILNISRDTIRRNIISMNDTEQNGDKNGS